MKTFFIYGINLIEDLLSSNERNRIKHIYVRKNDNLIKQIIVNQINYTIWSKEEFKKKFPKENHQYIIAEVQEVNFYSAKILWENLEKNEQNQEKLILILDHLQDSYNFGNIIRTAKAVGVHGIIIPNKNRVSINHQTMKAAAHHLYQLQIYEVANLNDCVQKLKKHHFWIASTSAKGNIQYQDVETQNTNIALIIGNESNGVSRLLQKNCDFNIAIPMKKVESLNVSNATAILLYEIRKKQNYWKKN